MLMVFAGVTWEIPTLLSRQAAGLRLCSGKETYGMIPSRSSTLRISSNLAEMLPSGKQICPRP
jgi:hypothetical protein